MNTNIIAALPDDDCQFYPTPDAVAGKMLAGIDWRLVQNVLEPSAGKGNLVSAALKAHHANTRYNNINIDCIEIDSNLRAILKENFSPTRKTNVHIVHDNFLTYRGWRNYELILMNPPFADGDLHLLKALELQKDGGTVICLLNAETINNPYTNSRKLLQRKLDELGAQITFLENAFRHAERTADVDVAIVRVIIPHREEYHSDIWERMEKAAKTEQPEESDLNELVVGDYIEAGVQRYNVEIAASKELIHQYYALRPYITKELNSENKFGRDAILTLTIGSESNYSQAVDMEKYLRAVRLKYWRHLFHNEKFMGRLTTDLRSRYTEKVDQMANYDFSLFNIRTVMVEINSQVIDGVKDAILTLFDKLTAEHSWYPESAQNTHYYNGWKTNKAHKIGKKSIIPGNGMFSSYSWKSETFDFHNAFCTLSDIEKVFDYLNGTLTDEQDIRERLEIANANGQTRNICLKYFKVDLFKKGTVHIKYTNMDLVDKMNIYAGRNKSWLPPCYGKAKYSEMAEDEKAIVDSFQGAKDYARIVARADYFLAEPTRNVPLLAAAPTN